ncbi:ATP-binding protein [Desulfobacterales bacterium HSG16]|nr:ATP-binding protein [Desulfobacterales bacterium HSG16]
MLRKEVEENNKMLEQRVLERTAELAMSYEEKIQLQRQVQQSQKMEAIGTLAGGIAHDFNNILFSMYGYLELILDKAPEESKTHDWTKNVLREVKRATSLVDQILTFSRQTRKDVMPMNVQYILSEVLKFTCATLPARITICQKINKKCGAIMADPVQIHQIAMNLIVNAYHAMENSVGELTVKLGEIHMDQKKSAEMGLDSGEYVCLTVEDTGIGMDGRTKARIFDPYFTTKKKGTGLGLSVIHGIVKNYGGGIDVHSEPGKGSKFQVYFPRIMEKKNIQQPEDIGQVPTGYEKILLIDNEKEIVNTILNLLKKLGYQVFAQTSSV